VGVVAAVDGEDGGEDGRLMSVRVSSWVWHEASETIAGNELVLLLALADVADDQGRCRFVEEGLTYDALAVKVRVSKRTVIRLVAELRERGVIDQVRGAKGRPNEFRVVVPWASGSGDKLAPNAVSGAADSVTSESDSVTDATGFGDNSDSRTSLIREDVDVDGDVVEIGFVPKGSRVASVIPNPFVVTARMREWAAQRAPSVNVDAVTAEFVAYWREGEGKGKRKKNWPLTWMNRMTAVHERHVERGWKPPADEDRKVVRGGRVVA
jgi:hypothetical protein